MTINENKQDAREALEKNWQMGGFSCVDFRLAKIFPASFLISFPQPDLRHKVPHNKEK